jgi:glycosyltransferase involved in cell wall biosynthesis
MIMPDEIPSFLRTLDVFCVPSRWEGFGVAFLEAMASGLPIIASDIPPHKELMDNAGILIPPENEDLFRSTLKRLIDSPDLRKILGKKALERVKVFSIATTVRKYETLFNDILMKKNLL